MTQQLIATAIDLSQFLILIDMTKNVFESTNVTHQTSCKLHTLK